jgi:hypothetical protein
LLPGQQTEVQIGHLFNATEWVFIHKR